MRRSASRKMLWWVLVPGTRKKSLKAESRMDIEEILKMKLATIIEEEPETIDQENGGILTTKHNSSCVSKKGKKIHLKVKMGRLFQPHFSLKESYVIFMTGLACRGGLHGLPRC